MSDIFVVDDDAAILETLTIILEEEGHRVTPMVDGEELLSQLEKEIPDIILLDFRLPGKNGAEVTRIVKNNRKTRSVPIIIVSADSGFQTEATMASADDFLLKPFVIDELLNIVNRYGVTGNKGD